MVLKFLNFSVNFPKKKKDLYQENFGQLVTDCSLIEIFYSNPTKSIKTKKKQAQNH